MVTTQIREELHEYIDTVDERKLEAIYLVLKDNFNSKYSYSPDEIYNRRNRFINGGEETFTTKELIKFIHQNKL